MCGVVSRRLAREWWLLARNRKFESTSLQRGVCEPSVPPGFRDREILDLIGRTKKRMPARSIPISA
jgi:hypothetical protein